MKPILDDHDRLIINRLQDGMPVVEQPYRAVAEELGLCEELVIERLGKLKRAGMLSRVGPMYNAARLGGGLTLCAMAVPEERFEAVTEIVNSFPEVAHNYAREHHFNMWFVLATEAEGQAGKVIAAIEALTDVKVLNLPKLKEYFIGMKVEA